MVRWLEPNFLQGKKQALRHGHSIPTIKQRGDMCGDVSQHWEMCQDWEKHEWIKEDLQIIGTPTLQHFIQDDLKEASTLNNLHIDIYNQIVIFKFAKYLVDDSIESLLLWFKLCQS